MSTGYERLCGYVDDVLQGRVTHGKVLRDVCARHKADLETGYWRLEPDHVNRVVRFAELLPVIQGRYAVRDPETGERSRITLLPWQCFYLGSIFGWRDPETGNRRYRQAFLSISRKSGKTMLGAITGLYVFCVEDHLGAEIYSVAGGKDQASISWKAARAYINAEPDLQLQYDITVPRGERAGTLARRESNAIWKPLPRETHAGALDGLGATCVVADELHSWQKGESMIQALEYSQAGQADPLFTAITTSGVFTGGYWYSQEKYLQEMVAGNHDDPRVFYLGYHLDKGDNRDDPDLWCKSNPSLGFIETVDTLRSQHTRAKAKPREMLLFHVKQLNEWITGSGEWFSVEHYDAAKIPRASIDTYADHLCWAGVVPGYLQGVPCIAWLFRDEDTDTYTLRMEYILSESRIRRDTTLGLRGLENMSVVPGSTIPFQEIRSRLEDADDTLRFVGLGYEKNASGDNIDTEMARLSDEGFKCGGVYNSMAQMTGPIALFAQLIVEGRIRVEESDILDQQFALTSLEVDKSGEKNRLIPVEGNYSYNATTGPRAICYALAASTMKSKAPRRRVSQLAW